VIRARRLSTPCTRNSRFSISAFHSAQGTPYPSFLLLDEPFSGIDPIQALELQRIVFDLKRAGIGILMRDHNVRETLVVTGRA